MARLATRSNGSAMPSSGCRDIEPDPKSKQKQARGLGHTHTGQERMNSPSVEMPLVGWDIILESLKAEITPQLNPVRPQGRV
jgi:hypothetical protein